MRKRAGMPESCRNQLILSLFSFVMCTIAIFPFAFSKEESSSLEVVGTGLGLLGSIGETMIAGLAVGAASIAAAHSVVVR
jgi:hypothetical protein